MFAHKRLVPRSSALALIVLALLVACDSAAPETDRGALIALYKATDGRSWKNDNNWLSNKPIGQWHGVEVDEEGRVVGLHLGPGVFGGELPQESDVFAFRVPQSGFSQAQLSELGNLHIKITGNGLSGELPPELGNLAHLQTLDLSFNDLDGDIPPELGSLTDLQYLYLGWNQLSGKIPPEFSKLSRLRELSLSFNDLSGEIPSELSNLADLSYLALSANRVTGKIPPDFGNLVGLGVLDLSYNQLSGDIPSELGNLPLLNRLDLSGNQLNGCVPNGLQDRLDMARSDLGGLPFCP